MREGCCALCGKAVPLPDIGQPGRGESCEHCLADLHCCRQCRHYDLNMHNACREVRAEFVTDKERANFCGFYEFVGGSGESDPRMQQADTSKKKLKDLFK